MKKNNLLISLIVATGLILSFSGCSEDGYTEISLAQDQKAELTLASREYTELVELTGSVESKTETQVASKTAGRIANLLVDIGDEVQNGELIAVLAADETAVNLETSRINVENLDNTIAAQAKLLDQQIKSGEAAVRVAEANLEALELSEDSTAGSIAEQISLAEEQLKSAETQLQNTEEIAEQRLNSVYQTVNSALLNTLIVSENANNFADGLFNVSGEKKFFNEDIRRFLGTLEPQVKNDVKKTLQASLREWDIYKTLYDEQIKNSELTREEANSYLNQALTLLENIKIMLTDTYEVLDKSSVGAGFTEQDLTNLKNQTAQHAQEVEKAILTTSGNLKLGVKGILLTVDEIKTQNQAELSAAQSNIANAQQAVSAAKAGGKQNITNLDSQEIVI
jgi:multidrug efflux pump subunit AcrA (membrane-fusion protein)